MFFAYLLAAVGLTHIVVDGSILSWLRGWIVSLNNSYLSELITCYQCSGFWCGAALAYFMQPFGLHWAVDVLAGGFATSYAAMAGAALLNYLDRPWGATNDQPKA